MKWKIGWGTMLNCNMNCQFCYSKKTRDEVKNLKLVDWINFIDSNNKFIDEINYGTGENTLSKDWFTLVNYIRKNYPDIKQALTTNGYLSEQITLNKELEQIFADSIDEIDVSLDFADRERHNLWRGQPMAYQWATDTLEICNKMNKNTTIVYIGTNETCEINNLERLFEISNDKNAKLRMNIYRPTDGINEKTKEFFLSYSKLKEVIYYVYDRHKILSLCDPLLAAVFTKTSKREDPSGNNSIRILPDGSITPSTYLISENFRKENILNSDCLKNIDREEVFRNVFLNVLPQECKNCMYRDRCKGGVMDRRYLWYGSFLKRDPYCPLQNGDNLEIRKIEIYNDKKFTSIHDGYLPTIFFKA